ncbi:amidohydrolase family protein [Moorella sp. Hama-1]|uniref:amidohydrolase family protein n=1 Tax=Moorella sp. Hama-1 TaxID=2138101 RepID=UPI0019127575|nr:amidohydrolase [Moorella sp. Hama-1]BCV22298.1 amidohydrolase [Moorella sp. Hama-1]
MGYLLINGTIITVDRNRRIIRDGSLAIEGRDIVDIGPTEELLPRHSGKEVIDTQGGIIMPGLIDCHVHLAQALIRGSADDLPLADWLSKRVWVLQGNYTPYEGRVSAELCLLEMIKSGTTTFAETLLVSRYGCDGIAAAVLQSGMRGALAKTIMDASAYAAQEHTMYPGMLEDKEACLEEALALHQKWNGAGGGRLSIWLGPRPLGSSPPGLLREVAALARDKNMGIHIHFAEIREEVELLEHTFNKKPGLLLDELGLLGPRTLLVHSVWLSPEEMAVIRQRKTTIVHNPSSNAKGAYGFCPVPELLDLGVNVTLGCDGGPSNNTYDMLGEMKLAACLHKVNKLDPTTVPAEKVIEMATINGARALGLDQITGSLETGKRADVIILDCNKPHLVPNLNPVSTVVYAARGQDVDTVFIDGKLVMHRRRVMTMDEEAVLVEAKAAAANLLKKAGIDVRSGWPEY